MKNQKGFSVVIVLLALILVVAIGFTGYYVWNTQQNKNKDATQSTLDQKDKISTNNNSSPASTALQKTESISSTGTQKYLTISEWGVKIPIADSDSITYKITNYDPSQEMMAGTANSTASIYLAASISASDQCRNLAVSFVRYTNPNPSDDANMIKIDNYYYGLTGSPASCNGDQKLETLRQNIVSTEIPAGLKKASKI
jgi:cytoskeletal protein RodZ